MKTQLWKSTINFSSCQKCLGNSLGLAAVRALGSFHALLYGLHLLCLCCAVLCCVVLCCVCVVVNDVVCLAGAVGSQSGVRDANKRSVFSGKLHHQCLPTSTTHTHTHTHIYIYSIYIYIYTHTHTYTHVLKHGCCCGVISAQYQDPCLVIGCALLVAMEIRASLPP